MQRIIDFFIKKITISGTMITSANLVIIEINVKSQSIKTDKIIILNMY